MDTVSWNIVNKENWCTQLTNFGHANLLAFIRFSIVKAITTTTKTRGHLKVN